MLWFTTSIVSNSCLFPQSYIFCLSLRIFFFQEIHNLVFKFYELVGMTLYLFLYIAMFLKISSSSPGIWHILQYLVRRSSGEYYVVFYKKCKVTIVSAYFWVYIEDFLIKNLICIHIPHQHIKVRNECRKQGEASITKLISNGVR